MPLRDVALTVVVFALLPVCLMRPWIGVLVWSWLGYMNPHRLAWGFAFDFPYAQLVGIATLTGLLLTRDRKPIPWVRETFLLAGLWVIFTLSTITALYPAQAWPQWIKVSKILLFTFVTLMLFQDRGRLRYLFLVIALSLGFFGLKGGIWAIMSGGGNMVMGPAKTFISGNTAIGLALNMALPFLLYLARQERKTWTGRLMWVVFLITIPAVIFTYSRGAILGLAAVLAVLFLKGRQFLIASVAIVLALVLANFFAPDKWWDRMATVQTYEEDNSAMNRLVSWKVATLLALDRPLTGGGFWSLAHAEVYERYGYEGNRTAHSIYFAVLGDTGFVGLALFVALILSCLWSLLRLRRTVGRTEAGRWVVGPSLMLEASLVAYMVSGAFLTEAYFDLFYHLVSFVILLKVLGREHAVAVEVRRPEPARSPLALMSRRV